MDPPDEVTDRRVLRGHRNREAILDALIQLIDEGTFSPTADQIAERAGVARRSLYHHFDDLESIAMAVSERHWEHVARTLRPLPTDGPLDERLDAFVGQRARLFEVSLPMYRASLLTMHEQPAVQERLVLGHAILRYETSQTFAIELQDGPTWKLETADAISSFDGWLRLRVNQRLSLPETEHVVQQTLRAVFVGD